MFLFESAAIGTVTLPHRIVRSATHEGLADEAGMVTGELIAFLERLAGGGAGLIITGHAYVSPEGKASPRQLGIYGDECSAGLAELALAVHRAGAKIFLQLAHAGAGAREKISGQVPIGPASTTMTKKVLARIADDFARAARCAEAAGFDGVQIHAAHGYLLSQFLSPFYNTRTDVYGGALEGRMRFVLDVVRSVRAAVSPAFPVTIKLNSEDFLERGFTQDDMLATATRIQASGIDAIELSGGALDSPVFSPIRKGDPRPAEEGYYQGAAKRLKERIHVPLILVGGFRSYERAEAVVREGIADMVALSRPLICEPELIARWQRGNRARATCVSCNLCFRPLMTGKGLRCMKRSEQ